MLKILRNLSTPKQSSHNVVQDIKAIQDISKIDHRQLALCIISAILSDLIYIDCDQIISADVLVSLGLVIRFCHTSSTTKTKMMAFSKASPEELGELANIKSKNMEALHKINQGNTYYRDLLTSDYKYNDNISSIEHRKNIKLHLKYNELTKDFIKPYYSPKFNEIISSLFKFTDRSGLIRYITNDDLFIVFRGTITGNDIYTDLQFPMVTSDITPINIKLHRGFLKAFKSISLDLDNLLNVYQEKRNIIFTGHSLGAALASIAVMDYTGKQLQLKMGTQRYQNAGLISFGSPRITDEVGSNYFTNLLLDNLIAFHIRLCNQYDPVVFLKIPSASLNSNYRHLPSKLILDNQPIICTSIVFNLEKENIKADLIDQYKSRYKSGVNQSSQKFISKLTSNIITHFMGNYIINLINHLPKHITRGLVISIDLQSLTNKS